MVFDGVPNELLGGPPRMDPVDIPDTPVIIASRSWGSCGVAIDFGVTVSLSYRCFDFMT